MAHHHQHDAQHDDPDLAELLDLDAEVLHGYWSDALDWLRQEATGRPGKHILDLGAGTGTGAIGLAERFADAEVLAVDAAAPMLERIRAKADRLGLADRIHTRQADLDEGWPAVGEVDISWASMSLHHLADPDRLLAALFAATSPGGLIAVAEFSEPLRYLADEFGDGLESRCLAAQADEHAQRLPHLGSDWAPRLAGAGFTVLAERAFRIDQRPPLTPAAVRYARRWLGRMRSNLRDRLDPADLDLLAALVDGAEPMPAGLHLRGTRTVILAGKD